MKAVYSFWGKPFWMGGGGYWNGRHFLSLLGLSAAYSRQHFSSVSMFCCSGSKALFESLGWFDEVVVSMDKVDQMAPRHWAAAKMSTFALQSEPFLHIDNDAFISRKLKRTISLSPLISQCPEHYVEFSGNYRPQMMAVQNHPVHPDFWHEDWVNFSGRNHKATFAYNTGVFGGCDIEAIKAYANSAVDFTVAEGDKLPDINTTIEQAYLAMFSYNEQVPVKIIISDWRNNSAAKEMGYCHYWGGTKRDKNRNGKLNLDILEERFKHEFPEAYKAVFKNDIHSQFDKIKK